MSVNNVPAKDHAPSKNGHILNFKVIALRDVFMEK